MRIKLIVVDLSLSSFSFTFQLLDGMNCLVTNTDDDHDDDDDD
jgi:hypothetical protein